ncbi:MAG: response regulator transcription factor [Anaerolineales bacterium]|nr:response regulator transcription factor [Anaerolineales bacterium]
MKVVIVDDHNLFREGLAAMIRREPDIEVISLVGTVQEAVETVQALQPDIVLMDFSLPDGTGADATRKIVQDLPECKVIFMTMSDKDEDLFEAVRSGAVGYLMKNLTPVKLVETLRAVQRGEGALSGTMTLRLMKEFSRTKEPVQPEDPALGKLTSGEKTVLAGLVADKSNQEIALQLHISENTVKSHVHSILGKLNLRDRKEAARFAREHGYK